MKYKRITERRETPLVMSMWAGDSESLKIYNRLAELEDKIERGEIDYIANKDKEVARLTEENDMLKKEVDNLSHENDELEYKNECLEFELTSATNELFGNIEQLKAENAELRARLDKAVELPYMYEAEVVDSAGHFLKTIYVVVYNNNGTIQAIQYSYKKVAEARLKEIHGGEI